MRGLLVLLMLSFVLAFDASTSPAEACSGGGPPNLDDLLEQADVVVRASVELDNGYEGMLRVSQYLVGDVGYMGLVISQPPGSKCNRPPSLPEHGSGSHIFFLTEQFDGSYGTPFILTYESAENTHIFSRAADDHTERLTLTEPQLLQEIGALSRLPVDNPEFLDIFSSPFFIMSENHTLYMLPMGNRWTREVELLDTNVEFFTARGKYVGWVTENVIKLLERREQTVIEFTRPQNLDCMNTECIALSNNGRIVAVQIDTDTVVICDLTGYCSPSEEEQTRLRGSGFRISPDSDAIAIWRNDEIVIYNGIIAGRYYDSPLNPLDVVSSTTVHGASHSWRGVWSEDSRWLAFSDEQGLWLWDVFTQPPTLLLPTESDYIPYARFFSNSGRYLGVSTADGNLILDLQSDLIFPDGIIAPDERHLITVDTVTNQLVVAEQCDLLTDHCEEVCANTDVTPMIYGAQWYSNLPLEWEPRLLVCNQEGCSPNYQFPYDICTASPTANNIVYFRETGAFTADVISTIQVGDYELESDYMGPSLSLEDSIDSPILDIRWPS